MVYKWATQNVHWVSDLDWYWKGIGEVMLYVTQSYDVKIPLDPKCPISQLGIGCFNIQLWALYI